MSEYEVSLTTMTYGGEVLGRLPDGRAVFVPLALPGEKVRIRLTEDRKNFARGMLLEVIEPSPLRITPRCLHFGYCGGCHYQHMPYEEQLKAKTEIVRDQLQRIGKLENIPITAAVGSPKPFYYRNHVQFGLTEDGKLGYHRLYGDEIFPIQECHLPVEGINIIWPQLEFETLLEIERVAIRQGAGDDIMITLESSDIDPPELSLEELDVSVVHLSEAGALVMAGSDNVDMEVLGREFRVSAGSFFQVNTEVAGRMVEHLLAGLDRLHPLTRDTTVLDLYCGAGLFSAFLAPRVGNLIGLEESPAAVDDFVENLDEFDHVSVYEGKVEHILPLLNMQADIIVVDPPRAGLTPAALDEILKIAPRVLAYVSCDPSTLARDLRRLTAGGYRLENVTPFDMFPQTYHVECVVLITRVNK